jgi:hypothetical protein
MDMLEVPQLLQIPDPAHYDFNVCETADYLMTMLFQRSPAVLHAEFHDGVGRWFVRSWRTPQQTEECVASSENVDVFRIVLARFGAHYMDTQLYGGHTLRQLSQRGQCFTCRFFMSNDNWSGHWIRIYSKQLDEKALQRLMGVGR